MLMILFLQNNTDTVCFLLSVLLFIVLTAVDWIEREGKKRKDKLK